MMSGGSTSGRVERSCPNLTKVGPSSSSISRRCWPRCEGAPSAAIRCCHGSRSVSLWVSKKYPNPCLTATWAISEIRPRFRVLVLATGSVCHAHRPCPVGGWYAGEGPVALRAVGELGREAGRCRLRGLAPQAHHLFADDLRRLGVARAVPRQLAQVDRLPPHDRAR